MRWALAISGNTPPVTFDARDPQSVRNALLAVLNRALSETRAAAVG